MKKSMLNTRVLVPMLLIFCMFLATGLQAQETPYQWKEEAERQARDAEKALAEIQRLCGVRPPNATAIEEQVNRAEKAKNAAKNAQSKVGNSKDFKDDAAKAAAKAEEAFKGAKNNASGIAKRRAICNFASEESARLDGEDELCKGQKATAKNVLKGICEKAEEASRINPCDSTAVNDSIDAYVKVKLADEEICDVYKDWLKNLIEINKSGKGYRVPVALASMEPQPKNVWLSGNFGFPLTQPDAMSVSAEQLKASLHDPEVFEALYETLQGEFFLGDFSGSKVQNVEMAGQNHIMPGLNVGVRLGKHFELHLGAQQYRKTWSGNFDVTVIPYDQTKPHVVQGAIGAEQTGMFTEAGATWLAGNQVFRPFVRAGVRADIPLENTLNAELANVPLAFEQPQKGDVGLAPFGSAGLQVVMWNRVVLETSCSYGKIGDAYVPAAGLGLGVGF